MIFFDKQKVMSMIIKQTKGDECGTGAYPFLV